MLPEKTETAEELQPWADLFAEPRGYALQWDVREIWPESKREETEAGRSNLNGESVAPV